MTTPTRAQPTAGQLFSTVARTAVRAAVQQAVMDQAIVEYTAKSVYELEVSAAWEHLSPAEKALWRQRVSQTLTCLIKTLGG